MLRRLSGERLSGDALGGGDVEDDDELETIVLPQTAQLLVGDSRPRAPQSDGRRLSAGTLVPSGSATQTATKSSGQLLLFRR